ncbi:aspartic peptidase domain-containing protein [Trichoderma austrokoningii]
MRLDALIIAAAAGIVYANEPAPVAFDAGEWLGIDGNWSTIKVLLGSNSDLVNVLLSTSLSELWAVGPGGCLQSTSPSQHDRSPPLARNLGEPGRQHLSPLASQGVETDLIEEPHCSSSRGGIYTPFESKHWSYMGIWQLGLDYLGYGGNGQYGLDTVNAYSTITDIGFGMSNVLMSAINSTDYYIGFFGLGITQGSFGNEVAQSPLTQAVRTFGWIPSYSYGYTAGASYRNIPVSITLGGSDTARYVPHDIDFTLTPQDNMPRALIRGIEAFANNGTEKPKKWDSQISSLSSWDNSFTALIDSTTPYLWLPNAVCDQFADAFNLTYNSTFDLYTLTNEQYNAFGASDSFTFTFSLSSFDNHDNFGSPLDVPGLVNITVPMQAFVGLLQYPFKHGAIKYGDPAVPYFALRRTQNDSSIIIGRSFLQEAYLITKYDEAVFSVYQAKFPQEPVADASLIPIKQPNNSPYPGPPTQTGTKLSTAQLVGITVGAVVLCLFCLVCVCYMCRRRKSEKKGDGASTKEVQDGASIRIANTPKKSIFLCGLSRLKRLQGEQADMSPTAATSDFKGVMDSEAYELPVPTAPVELPAPMAPVELDASDGDADDISVMGNTTLDADTAQNLCPYEVAQKRIERRLRGSPPEYYPSPKIIIPQEKAVQFNASPTNTASSNEITPVSPARSGLGTASLVGSLSPISSGSGYNSHNSTNATTVSTGQYNDDIIQSNTSLANTRDLDNMVALHSKDASSSMACQKTPIDPTNIECLGNLPENLQSLRHSIMLAQIVSQENNNTDDDFTPRFNADCHLSDHSLGSNYTEEEDRMMQEMSRQATFSLARTQRDPSSAENTQEGSGEQYSFSQAEERIGGNDIVHIPQMAAKRYSWED